MRNVLAYSDYDRSYARRSVIVQATDGIRDTDTLAVFGHFQLNFFFEALLSPLLNEFDELLTSFCT